MYVVIQSCFGYENYLNYILQQLEHLNIQDIILVYNRAKSNNIEYSKHIKIFTTDNLYELSSFKQLAIHHNNFNKFDKFLFLHDTVDFGPNFKAKLEKINSLLDSRSFDWAPLAYNFQCMMGILPGMRQQGQGTIINIASIAAKQAFAGWGAYCVSKAGLLSLSQTLAQEERANGIRVIAICPGSVNTEIWDTPKVHANFDRSRMLTPEIVAATILHAVLLPQQAVIEELTIMSNAGVL